MDREPARTLYDKIFDDHVAFRDADGTCTLYIDRHLVEDHASPQAFDGLRQKGLPVHAPGKTLAVVDHNVPTTDRSKGIDDAQSRIQVEALARNTADFGIEYFNEYDIRQGIVHVIGPEQGFSLPGTTIVCGDSHTSTHGAFGALAFGIGTSDVEHVLATQTLIVKKSRTMRITVDGALPNSVTAKDLILSIIGTIGTAGATGHSIEFAGEGVRMLSMEGRMTLCNMSIEAGATVGMVAPDEITFAYLKGRPKAPTGRNWETAMAFWQTLATDEEARFDREVRFDARNLPPVVTWGTSPHDVIAIDGVVPDPEMEPVESKRAAMQRALVYMGLTPGTRITDVPLDVVWIGSCTNGRIEDLRQAAEVVKGKRISERLADAMVVPGSGLVKRQAEAEGLDETSVPPDFNGESPAAPCAWP